MRYYSSYVLFATQKEQCEGKLPVGVEKQGLCYRLCRFLGLYSYFFMANFKDFTIHYGKRYTCPFEDGWLLK